MKKWLGLGCLVWMACSSAGHALDAALMTESEYPLDDVSRSVVAGNPLPCERGELELVSYKGELLHYQKPLRVHPAFRAQLVAFEGIVDELGREHFGRAPRRILHMGAYACRPMRRHAHWMSEHALGNAIDVAGFDFGPATRKMVLPPELPKGLRRGFQIRVDKHWEGTGAQAPQAEFLRALAARIIERPDVFRAIVGPGWPGHDNHFHLGHPPYRMVKVGQTQRWFW